MALKKDEAVDRAVEMGLYETKTAARKVAVGVLNEQIEAKERERADKLYEMGLATPAEIAEAVREQAEDERSNDEFWRDEVAVGGPYDKVANPEPQPEPQIVDMICENQIPWREPKQPAPLPPMNRAQRRRHFALTSSRQQRLAARS